MKIGKRSVRLGMAVAAVAATLGARAATWTGGVDGPWSAGGNWDGGSGAPPVSGPTTQLMFSNSGTGFTTTNDLGPFSLNALTLDNTGTGVITVAGNPLTLDGTTATIVGTGAGDKLVKNNLTLGVDTTVTNTGGLITIGAPDADNGTPAVTFAAGTTTTFNGAGNVTVGPAVTTVGAGIQFGNNVTIRNTGAGTLALADGGTYAGTNVTVNLANTGGGVFTIGDLAAVSGTLNVTAGTVKWAGAAEGDLFGANLVLNVAAGATFDFANNGETFGGLGGAGNVVMGNAGLEFTLAGDRTFSGSIGGTGGVTQANAGVLTLSGSNAYTGATTINSGGTIRTAGANVLSAGSLITITAGQGALDLAGFGQTIAGVAGGQYNSTLQVNGSTLTLSGSATRSFNGLITGTGNLAVGGTGTQTILGASNYTGTTAVNGGTLRIVGPAAATGAGTSIATGATLDLILDTDTTWTAPLTGTGTLAKSGTGKLTLGAANPGADLAGLMVNGGTVALDYSADNGSKLGTNPALTLDSGGVVVTGNSAAPTTLSFSGAQLNGAGRLALTSGNGQAASITLGNVTRRTGGSIDFGMTGVGGGTGTISTSSANGSTGILGGFATVNGADWAVNAGGNVAALPAGSYANNTFTAGSHTNVTSSFTVPTAGSTASVRFNTAGASTLTLSGVNNVTTGGILVTPTAGANNVSIAGGTLTAPAGQELLVHQHNAAGMLTISSVIGNTANATQQTVAAVAAGSTINGLTSTTGLYPGMLVTGTGIPTNARIMSVNSPTSITLTANATAGANVALTFNGGTVLAKSGPGTLALTGTNTFMGLILNEGVLSASAAGHLGPVATNAASGSIYFNGGTLRATNSINISTSGVQPWVFGPGGGTVDTSTASVSLTRNGNAMFGTGTLTKTGPGTMSIGSNGGTFAGRVVVNGGVMRFTSSVIGSANGMTVNPGGQYLINDDSTANFGFAANSILSLAGSGPAGSATPGAMALTVQGTAQAPTTTFTNSVYLAADAAVGTYNLPSAAGTTTLIFSNAVTGPGSLIKAGDGTLALNSAFNNYTGKTIVTNGTLRIGGADRLPAGTTLQFGESGPATSGTFELNGFSQTVAGLTTVGTGTAHQVINSSATAAALTVNTAAGADQTFVGRLGGDGIGVDFSFTKTGAGTLTLSGANTYTGPTTVSAGTLRVAGADTAARAYTVADGARLTVANSNPASTFNVATLALGTTTGGNLGFDLSAGTPGQAALTIAGDGGLTTAGAVDISVSSLQGLSAGAQIPLLKYTGTIGGAGFAAFQAGTLGLPSRVIGSLVNLTGTSTIALNVTGVDFVKWTGSAGGAWDVNATASFKLNSNGAATTYLESAAPATGDTVVFDETAAGTKTVSLAAALRPAAVTVSGPADYTFTGAGKLSGPTGLTKAGAGTLTLLTDNDYTGVTTITGGTLRVGNGGTVGSLGAGAVTNDGALVMDRSDDVALANAISGAGSLTKNGPGTLTLSAAYGLTGNTTITDGTLALTAGGTYSGNVAGAGALLKGGTGTLVLDGAVAHTGGTTVSAGTLRIGSGGTAGSLAGGVTISTGATLAFNRSDDSTFAGTIIGDGNLTQIGSGRTTISGTIGTLVTNGMTTARVYAGVATASAGNFDFNLPTDVSFSGRISGTGTITKSGPSTLTLLANNNFTGTLVVDGGTALLDDQGGGGDLNAASIVVNAGGKFQFGRWDGPLGTGSNPDMPDSTAITVNAGGEFQIRIGEQYGALKLAGGTYRAVGDGAALSVGSTFNATSGPFTGFALESGQVIAENFGPGATAGINGGLSTGLVKTTPGTVTFTGPVAVNANNPINIQEGTLAFEAQNLPASGAGAFTLGGGATTATLRLTTAGPAASSKTLTVNTAGQIDVANPAGRLTLTGLIDGGGTLSKVGPGTLVLGPDTGLFGGTVSVEAGAVRVSGTTAFGGYSVSNGAKLAVAGGATTGTFALPSLALGAGGSRLSFELAAAGNPTVPLMHVTGDNGLTLAAGTHVLGLSSTQPLSVGTITLIDYAGTPITSGFTLGALPSRTAGTLVYNTANTSIDVQVTGADTTIWNGATGGAWDAGTAVDVGGTANFRLASTAAATNFVAGDRVTFDDTAPGTGPLTVNLTAALQPAAVTVNADTRAYTLAGPGSIAGTGGLTKTGAESLALLTDNTYTGGTTVSAGTLQIGNGGSTGSITGPLAVGAGTTVIVDRAGEFVVAAPLSGTGDLVKRGPGTLKLTGENQAFTGALTVNGGTVDLNNGADLNAPSVVVNDTGTFVFGETGDVNFPNSTFVTANAGGTFDLRQGETFGGVVLKGGTIKFSGARTGVNITANAATGFALESGTVTTDFTGAGTGGVLSGTTALNKTTAGTVTLGNGVTINTGVTINVREGVLAMPAASLPATGSTSINLGDETTAGTLRVTDAAAAATVRPVNLAAGGGTIDVAAAGGSVTLAGAVGGTGGLTKAGNGQLVLGVAAHTGATTVAGGTLRVNGSVAASAGVAVGTGGRFVAGSTQTVKALDLSAGGRAEVANVPASLLVLTIGDNATTDALKLGATAKLDVRRNTLVFDHAAGDPSAPASVAAVRATILAGYNNGDWLGATGITSSDAAASPTSGPLLSVGYATTADLLGAGVTSGAVDLGQGVSPTVDDTGLLVRLTLAGDADLNGVVGLNDLVRLANHYGSPATAGWFDGDFDHNGTVGLNDLVQLANNYGSVLGGPATPAPDFAADWALAQELAAEGETGVPTQAVPEPGALGLAGVAAAALLGKRRRRA
ncbi:MAG TPA: autotransporter-associated beta strand repeat-containing protein [Tepidisphaeraceae bacterium]|nr:autotransporter-associated beta strand repeat-containing protein [Tepidisphaeraceae bacterium]